MSDMEHCPVCGKERVASCRCLRNDSHCENGHYWHICTVHNRIVEGSSDRSLDILECTCGIGGRLEQKPKQKTEITYDCPVCEKPMQPKSYKFHVGEIPVSVPTKVDDNHFRGVCVHLFFTCDCGCQINAYVPVAEEYKVYVDINKVYLERK